MISKEHRLYLRKQKKEKILVHLVQILILLLVLVVWEYLSNNNIINAFIYSSPSNVKEPPVIIGSTFLTYIPSFSNPAIIGSIVIVSL